MEKVLAEINAVASVRGSFFCDRQGEVIASVTLAGSDTTTLNSIGRQVTLTSAALETAGEGMNEMDFAYQGARLVARDLGNAVLVVLCEPQVETAMLRLTLNVVTARLKGDRGIQSRLRERAADKEVVQGDMDETSWHLLKTLEVRR